ncbi:hypothetical protein GPECTOR_1g427 [Gonium pectorale]|uniref:Uncharacterized protein n=1 Tax=Gonium pectorale TaxID=33097 RepID=A0A150H2S2_GONPE|nr:hypothetical protein GPECTOR_1g427 [Gonium pectorale]|eukprot:KXZ56477.1 hypothetical protein GPECTOR_1g427 [Gonium pectorale]
MLAVGTAGRLGCVWRCPPLALAEFSTAPAEALNPHSLAGVRAMLRPGDPAAGCLAAAARAQALREATLEVSVRHNQILLDGIIRKLDRRRRVLLHRAAAMEGVVAQEAMDVVVGGPPGSYAPAHHPLTNEEAAGWNDGNLRPPPPLLREPPGDRLDEYHKHRRSSTTSATLRRAAASPTRHSASASAAALDARSLEDLRQRRRALTAAAGSLYWDVNEIKLRLRVQLGRAAAALERVTADARLPAATAPHDAMALREYFAAGMWAHDRLRDALVWRSLLMESPQAFPTSPPSVAAYLRRYHQPAPPLLACLCPPPQTVAVLQDLYDRKVMRQQRHDRPVR